MSNAKLALFATGLAAAALGMSKTLGAAPGGQLTRGEVRDLVRGHKRRFAFPNVPEDMARAVVEIESDRKPWAIRAEPHIADFSAGLMQTLIRTAADMHDKGWRAYPRPSFAAKVETYDLTDARRVSDSPAAVLFRPEVSVYYGMAYLQWLTSHSYYDGTDNWQVRAYNGGPGGGSKDYTLYYWDRYQRALQRVRNFDAGV